MSDSLHISVLGAGAWGSALAVHFSAAHEVTLWTRSETHAQAMAGERQNARYLPGIAFPPALRITHHLDAAIRQAGLLIAAVPSGALRALLAQLSESGVGCPLIWVCKGFEADTNGVHRCPHRIPRALSRRPLDAAAAGMVRRPHLCYRHFRRVNG